MYAVIETGSKQYKVTEGDILPIERLKAEKETDVVFDKVLLIANDGKVDIGEPYGMQIETLEFKQQ